MLAFWSEIGPIECCENNETAETGDTDMVVQPMRRRRGFYDSSRSRDPYARRDDEKGKHSHPDRFHWVASMKADSLSWERWN
jgi:hypothetical protein